MLKSIGEDHRPPANAFKKVAAAERWMDEIADERNIYEDRRYMTDAVSTRPRTHFQVGYSVLVEPIL